MNKSQIKEVRRKLNIEIENAWDERDNWNFYHEHVWKEIQKTWADDVKDTKESKKLRTLLYSIERPEVHTLNGKFKKIPQLRALGFNVLADHYENFLNRFKDKCDEVNSLVPEAKPEPKVTPLDELIKRDVKKQDFLKYLQTEGKGVVGNYKLNKDGTFSIGKTQYGVGEEVAVGIKLGDGDRAHRAIAYTGKHYLDKEKTKWEWAVFVSRNDQFWRSYRVAILTQWENIPDNLKSER